MSSICCDVVIVGGGVAGLTTALSLASQSSLQIVLLEARSAATQWVSAMAGERVSAISPASQRIFEKLGVWEWIAAREISPFHGMHVWNAEGAGVLDFKASDAGVPDLGHIVANRLLEAGLFERLKACPAVKIVHSAVPSSLHFHTDYAEIQTARGDDFRARLVVGADGAHSAMREMAGLSQTVRSYGQTALVASVKTQLPHEGIARQCFLPTGPLAFLPLSSPDACSIVWSVDDTEALRLQALSDGDFAVALTDAFQYRLGETGHVTGRRAFPLVKRHAETYVRPRFALVGDAAHTIHPLAGQGMNLGLQDAVMLADTVLAALTSGRQFAALHTLRRYERARKTDNLTMLAAMDFFRYFSAASHPVQKKLWQVGMQWVNQLKGVKTFLMEYALGKRG